MLWTMQFWKGTAERVLKTFVEVFVPTTLATLGATAEGVLNAWTAPWLVAVQTGTGLALGASAIAFLIAIGNADFVAGPPVGSVQEFRVDPPKVRFNGDDRGGPVEVQKDSDGAAYLTPATDTDPTPARAAVRPALQSYAERRRRGGENQAGDDS